MTAGDTATPIFDTVVSELGRKADPEPDDSGGSGGSEEPSGG
jgi:hypothetical protein